MCGYACVTRNAFAWLIPMFLFCFFCLYNIPKLDQYLRQRYGAAFVDYERRTKRLVPFVLCSSSEVSPSPMSASDLRGGPARQARSGNVSTLSATYSRLGNGSSTVWKNRGNLVRLSSSGT